MITQQDANYYSLWSDGQASYPYDANPIPGPHPLYATPYPHASPVGSFPPNSYGLYDMAGNMLEFCWDRYGYYTADTQTNPSGPVSPIGSARTMRGGCWNSYAFQCRTAFRAAIIRETYGDYLGFRCVRGVPAP